MAAEKKTRGWVGFVGLEYILTIHTASNTVLGASIIPYFYYGWEVLPITEQPFVWYTSYPKLTERRK